MLTKGIDTIIDIDSFDHKCVIIKGLLQSEQLKKNGNDWCGSIIN